jgi:hypothetical protein
MRIIRMWVVPLIVVAGIATGVSYFQADMFHRSIADAAVQQRVWLAVPHPPGDHVQPQVPMVKEFGAWHLACLKGWQEHAPRVGYIENLGIVSTTDTFGKAEPCHVFIMMRDPAAPQQTMMMSFRYLTGIDAPELAVLYTTLGLRHVVYDPTGRIHDLSRKEQSKGIFFTDLTHAPSGENPPVQSQNIPKVEVQLGRTTLTMPTTACLSGHCFAHLRSAQTGEIGPGIRIVVRIPGRQHGQPRVVDVPADGLRAALAELGRLKAS